MPKEEKTDDMGNLEKLIKERDSIQKQLRKLKDKLKLQFWDDELRKKINRKAKLLFEIEKTIELYAINPIYTNGKIDLYSYATNKDYLVCFHGEKKIVGSMRFGDSAFDDNISYFINEEYRNKGLGFQAVCLLLEYLNSKGIDHVTIHVEKTNLPSLRLVEKIKDIYQCSSISDYENSIAFHICVDNEKSKLRQ